MKKVSFIITGLILFSFVSCLFAQETVTITTYYPAPYGIYDALRFNPNNTPPSCAGVIDSGNEGMLHFDNGLVGGLGAPGLYVCNDQGGGNVQWEIVDVDTGGTGHWELNDLSGDNDLLFPDTTCCGLEWVIGIGTTQPGEFLDDLSNLRRWDRVRLHVVNPNDALPLANRRFCKYTTGSSVEICTSAVFEGRAASVVQIMSQDLTQDWGSHLIFSGLDETESEPHRLWFLNAWGPDQGNRFSIGYTEFLGTAFGFDGQSEHLNITTDGLVTIPGELDIGFVREWDNKNDAADGIVDGKAEAFAKCLDGRAVITGGCECGASVENVHLREAFPYNDGIDWGFRCQCFAPAGAVANTSVQARAYCGYITN